MTKKERLARCIADDIAAVNQVCDQVGRILRYSHEHPELAIREVIHQALMPEEQDKRLDGRGYCDGPSLIRAAM